jgi:hypothetical protein
MKLLNLYLLRVGSDYTSGGFHSHIFPNKSYLFIPIPGEKQYLQISKAITYQNYRWQNQPVLDYLPPRILDVPNPYVHDDPEFKTFTYGSPQFVKNDNTEKNYKTLSKLKSNDMLTFYAAFTMNGHGIEGLYFFAYFIVDRVINLDKLTNEEMDMVKGNHHFIHRDKLGKNQVIVKGNSHSRVLKRAVLLSSRNEDRRGSNYYPCAHIQNMLGGYSKSMNRSSIRKICLPESGIHQFKQYLDDNGM